MYGEKYVYTRREEGEWKLSFISPSPRLPSSQLFLFYCVVTPETSPGSGNSDLATGQEGGEEGRQCKQEGQECRAREKGQVGKEANWQEQQQEGLNPRRGRTIFCAIYVMEDAI